NGQDFALGTVHSGVTLRDAIQAANTDTSVNGSTTGNGADTIVFAPALNGTTLNLSIIGDTSAGPSALLVSSAIIITGPTGASGITIARDTTAGTPAMRLFDVSSSGNLTLQNLTLSNGLAQGGNGGGYGVARSDSGGGGAAGLGGAIYNAGTLQLIQSAL